MFYKAISDFDTCFGKYVPEEILAMESKSEI